MRVETFAKFDTLEVANESDDQMYAECDPCDTDDVVSLGYEIDNVVSLSYEIEKKEVMHAFYTIMSTEVIFD